MCQTDKSKRNPEAIVNTNFLRKNLNEPSERMNVEDLAALDRLSEDVILQEFNARLKRGQFHTFIGDILVVMNPNEHQDVYSEEVITIIRLNRNTKFCFSTTKNINSNRVLITHHTYIQ